MATIAENLQTIQNIKQDIKRAIENKGVDMSNTPFTEYSTKIDEITTSGGGSGTFVIPDGMKFQGSTFSTLPDSLDFSEITDMSYLFEDCYNLNDGNINTNSAINMEGLFAYCYNMITAPELKTSKVTNMRKMFYGGISYKMKLETVPFYDTTNVTDMSLMFD